MKLEKAHRLFEFGIWAVLCVFVVLVVATLARAAETLPAVSPPTDWTGVAVVAVIGIIAVAVTGYILYLKRPGMQFGEEQIEAIANALHAKMNPPTTFHINVQPPPMTFDGITFADQQKLDEYKAAKALVDSHRKETP